MLCTYFQYWIKNAVEKRAWSIDPKNSEKPERFYAPNLQYSIKDAVEKGASSDKIHAIISDDRTQLKKKKKVRELRMKGNYLIAILWLQKRTAISGNPRGSGWKAREKDFLIKSWSAARKFAGFDAADATKRRWSFSFRLSKKRWRLTIVGKKFWKRRLGQAGCGGYRDEAIQVPSWLWSLDRTGYSISDSSCIAKE